MTIDNRTPHLDLPLPHPDNLQRSVDVPRLIEALGMIDTAIFAKATPSQITSAIAALVAGAPSGLDTLNEIAFAINNDANFAATVAAALSTKASSSALAALAFSGNWEDINSKPSSFTPPIASAGVLGGFKVGTGLNINPTTGVLDATGSVGVMFTDLAITPVSNGQTLFTPAGGYTAGLIELFLNGVLLYGNGDDYTASNGTTITLTTGANTTDTLLLRRWTPFGVANVVAKIGDTMTGNLNFARVDKGTVGSGTVTFDVSAGLIQRLQVSGALTYAFSNWPTSGTEGAIKLKMVNWGSAVITPPTINWQLPSGGFVTNFATYLASIGRSALQSSGTDFAVFWSDDAGSTVYGKLV